MAFSRTQRGSFCKNNWRQKKYQGSSRGGSKGWMVGIWPRGTPLAASTDCRDVGRWKGGGGLVGLGGGLGFGRLLASSTETSCRQNSNRSSSTEPGRIKQGLHCLILVLFILYSCLPQNRLGQAGIFCHFIDTLIHALHALLVSQLKVSLGNQFPRTLVSYRTLIP